MANLEIPHSLLGTMVDPTALLMAEQQRILSQLRSEQVSKQQAASALGQEYAQAAAQPEPSLAAVPAATEQFFGDIASIISRRPEFQQRATQSLAEQKQRLLRNRATNLQAMRDRWEKMADAAERLDPVQALEARTQLDKIDKQLEGLMKQQEMLAQQGFQRGMQESRQAFESGEGAKDRASRERIAQIGADRPTVGRAQAEGYTPEGLMKPDFYRKELTKLRISANRATNKNDKDSAVNAIREIAMNKLANETAAQMYARLTTTPSPYETEGGFLSKKKSKPLLSADEILDLLYSNFPQEEVDGVIASIQARKAAKK